MLTLKVWKGIEHLHLHLLVRKPRSEYHLSEYLLLRWQDAAMLVP